MSEHDGARDIIENLSLQSERQYRHHESAMPYMPDPDVFHDGTLALDDAICVIAQQKAAFEDIIRIARKALGS